MSEANTAGRMTSPLLPRWRTLWIALAMLTGLPVAYHANDALLQTRLELHTRLIIDNSLWNSDASYAGSTRDWTRFAAWLLDTEQLLERLRVLHAAEAGQLEAQYRRDELLAFSGVIARFLAGWGVPLALAYAAGCLRERRRARRSA